MPVVQSPIPVASARPGIVVLAVLVWTSLACGGLGVDAEEVSAPAPVVAEPAVISPRFFYQPGPAGLETARFSRWKAGDRVFVASDGANLRSQPNTKGEVVTKLRLGEELEVLGEAGEPEVLIGRRNVWYRVRSRVGAEGYLFGAIVSPVRVPTFRGDEVEQVAVVSFSPTFGPRLRAWSPPDGPVSALDAEPPERYASGGTLSARAEGSRIVVSTCSEGSCRDVVFGFSGGQLAQLEPPPPPK